MARVNLMKNIVTSRRQPHTPLDNVNTPYNPIRWKHIISSFCMVMLYKIDHYVFKSFIFCVSDCWRGRLPARRRSTTTSASSPSWRPATTSSTPSIASTSPWSRWAASLTNYFAINFVIFEIFKASCFFLYYRLVRMSTIITTSFLGKVPWTGTFYFLPFPLLWTTCLLLAALTSDHISETSSSTTRS